MPFSQENPSAFPNDNGRFTDQSAKSGAYKRWYDQDPALSRALSQLRVAPDKYQAQVALNIIKIIVEHHIEESAAGPIDFQSSSGLTTSTPSERESLSGLKAFLKNLLNQNSQNGKATDKAGSLQTLHHWLHTDTTDQVTDRRRWYDVHEALCSAMQLLCDCPDDLQKQVIPTIAGMIEATLSASAPYSGPESA